MRSVSEKSGSVLKRIRVVLALSVIIVVGLAVCFDRRVSEPEYQGKCLSAWLEGYIPYSTEGMNKADEALRHIGSDAVPALLRYLQQKDSPLVIKLVGVVQKQPLVRINYIRPSDRMWQSMWAFRALGADGKIAVPALIELYERKPHRVEQRSAVSSALGYIGPPAAPAIPVLLDGARDPDNAVRCSAIFALGHIHQEPTRVVPVLVSFLRDPSRDARLQAIWGLEAFGADAQTAVPALVTSLKDTEPSVRENAASALKKLAPAAASGHGHEL